jgi:putative FmdB family regulatory protein
MPIYAYRCSACGHAKDVLQKLSDAPLTTCPACAAESFSKQVTAAGFQLKGSGWYATDFKGGGTAAPASAAATGGAVAAATASEAPKSEAAGPASSAHGGGSCACH